MADLATDFLIHRDNVLQASAGDELLQRLAKPKPAPVAPGAAAVPATDPTQAAAPGAGGAMGVAADIGTGVIETPRGVIKGARDAIQSNLDMGKELGDYIEQKLDLPVLHIGSDGVRFSSNEAEKGHRLSDLATLPDLNAPKSVTGGVVKGVSQFLVGLMAAKKYMAAAQIPVAAETAVGTYGLAALKGAVANFSSFDPHQQRLSNLIQQYPALANPVTEYLAAKPDDNAAESRFKNSVEGLGLGVLADSFVGGVRFLKNIKSTKAQADAALATAGPAPREVPPDAFTGMGDTTSEKLVEVRAKPAPEIPSGPDVTPAQIKAAQKAAGDPQSEVFINFARLDTPEDIQKAMGELATASKKNIAAAARGKQTFEEIKLNANERDAWKDINERRVGEPLNAEQSVAARQLWVSSAQKLTQLAEAASQNPSEANLFAFRKQMAIHDTIQTQVIAARTETARALASWRIPAGGNAERMRGIVAQLDATGGTDAARELATRVAALGRAGMTKELGQVVEKTAYAKTRDAVLEGWINGLLSGPATHAANTMSNSAVLALRMGERRVAESISSSLGTQGGVAAGETAAQYFGLVEGMKDMFRYYARRGRAFVNEDFSDFERARAEAPINMTGMADTTKIEHAPSISSEAFRMSNTGFLGRTVDFTGQLARTPSQALQAEDEFFKTVGYRMELHAQALRTAASEVHGGKLKPEALKQRIAEIVANPPENIRMAAADSALYQTFTNAPGEMARSLSKLTSTYPALKVIMPFVKTPANILKFTFERTPMAPLMSKFRADVAAGGARRDLALSQMATGTSAMLLFSDLAMNGQITGRGPVDKAEREALTRTGWKPYTMKIGDRWVPYNRLDPVGSLVGLSADSVETMRNAQSESIEDADAEKVAVATAIAFAGNLTNKTYLSGLSDVFEALSDPQRYGEATVQRMAGSAIPSIVAAANRVDDPYVREVNSMLDAIRARTPGLSEQLPAKRNLWGEPLSYESGYGGAVDFLSPVNSKPGVHEPIDEEILRTGASVTMPGKKVGFDGVTIDLSHYPQAYSRYVQLAGNELKHPAWKLGAKDLLNQVVTGQHPLSSVYRLRSDGPEGGKDFFIRDIVSKYRELARAQLRKEYPAIDAEVREKQANKRALKMPVVGGS